MTEPAREADVELVARIVCRRECARLDIPLDACVAGGCAAWGEWQEAACEIIAALAASPPSGDGEYARGLEDAARIIDTMTPVTQGMPDGETIHTLGRRRTGDVGNLAYAAAIRALLPKVTP